MIPMQNWRGRLVAMFLCVMAGGALAADLAIQSFLSTGQLAFNTLTTAETYRVEWSLVPEGPWTNFTGELDAIPGPGSGIVTCSVPMITPVTFYRVVASVTNSTSIPPSSEDYLVVDVSAGASVLNYPVSYLTSVPSGGWTDEYKTTKIVLRRISAGSFTMGSPTGELGRDDGETQHLVALSSDFYICVFEVTQRQWERVMGDWPSWFNNTDYRDSRPVEQVSFSAIRGSSEGAKWPTTNAVDLSSFVGRLRERTGKTFDLPTESQWEYACRASTATALNSGFDLLNTDGDANMSLVGRYWYNGGSGYVQDGSTNVATAKVGSYLPNAWGLYDMHGNVAEWCLDWYTDTYPGTVSDPKGAPIGPYRVFRGGNWQYYASDCRSARRNRDLPAYSQYLLGFRVVMFSAP